MEEDGSVMGTLIREARKRKGWSQAQLADHVGVQQQSVAKWENGTTAPRASAMAKLGQVLGIDETDLLEAAGYLTRREDAPEQADSTEPRPGDDIELDFNSAMTHVPDEVREAIIRIVKPYLDQES